VWSHITRRTTGLEGDPISRMAEDEYAFVHIEICEVLQFKLMSIGYGVTIAAFN
jgi:hypothetical protein